MYIAISFYRYTEIKNPEELRDQIRDKCTSLDILGRILIGEEGINGAATGKSDNIEKFKSYLRELYEGLTFREQEIDKHYYHKLIIRVRDEICAFGQRVDLKNTGTHVKPEKLKEWLDNNEDIILIDARNDYEYDMGHFKGAKRLPIKYFRQLPDAVNNLEELKDKKIVMYCTGGIRCEKASAYLKEQGFKDVNQLDGGIINYINQFSDSHWEGSCFVFDDRIVTQVGEPITECIHCSGKTDIMINCHNLECDKLHVSCEKCQEEMNNCCSNECKNAERHRPEDIAA